MYHIALLPHEFSSKFGMYFILKIDENIFVIEIYAFSNILDLKPSVEATLYSPNNNILKISNLFLEIGILSPKDLF